MKSALRRLLETVTALDCVRGNGGNMLSRHRAVAWLAVALAISSPVLAQDRAAPIEPPTWVERAPTRIVRADHTATALLDGRTLVVGGGSTPSGPGHATASIFDPATNTWQRTGPLARARFAHTATRLEDGRVLVVGGIESFSLPLITEVEIYDPETGAWSLAAPIPIPRSFHAAVLLNDGRVFVAGGDGPGAGDTPTALIYDPATDTWSSAGSMSLGREPGRFGAIVLPGGDVLVAGGYLVTTGLSVAAADRYNVATGVWTTLPNLGESRNGVTIELMNDGRALVIGGKNGSQIRYSTEIFDPAANTFTFGPSLSYGRWAHNSVNLGNGQILVIGGRTATGDTSTCELFEMSTLAFREVSPMNSARFKFGVTVTTQLMWFGEHLRRVRRILAVGGYDGTTTVGTAEEIIVPLPWPGPVVF
jgi:hypothetical protein